MKPTVFIHIGLHKTGTTTIQWALTESRDKLLQNNVLFPKTGVPDNAPYGQHLLAWSLIKRSNYIPVYRDEKVSFTDTKVDNIWEDLLKEIIASSPEKTIISSEEFDVLDAEEISEIGTRLSSFDIVPIIFIRNFADFVESSYRTAVLYSQYSDSIDGYAANQRTRLDFTQLAEDWSKIALNGFVYLISYDDSIVRNDSLAIFLKIVNVSPSLLITQSRQNLNESLPAFLCEIIRFFRLKGVEETIIMSWVGSMSKMYKNDPLMPRYSNLSAALRAQLDQKYDIEIQKIQAHPVLLAKLYGELKVSSAQKIVPIRHIVDALLALSWVAERGALQQ